MITSKEFNRQFLPFNEIGKHIWIMPNINILPKEIVDMALNLLQLHFINYLQITDSTLAASSQIDNIRLKSPLTTIGHPTAIGVKISYNITFKALSFVNINSPIKGNGSKMVDAILRDLPMEWQLMVDKDWSDGFWAKMRAKYPMYSW